MAEQNEPTTDPAAAPDVAPPAEQKPDPAPAADPEPQADNDIGDDSEKDGAEAARYRKRLRAAERERDELAGVVDAMRRADLARIATTANDPDLPRLFDSDDLFGSDYDLTAVLDDAGRVDEARVRGVISEATAERRHLRADLTTRPPKPDRSQGSSGGGPVSFGAGTWTDALRGR